MGRVAGFVLANGYSELEYVLLDWSMFYMIRVCFIQLEYVLHDWSMFCLIGVCFA